MTVTKGPVDPRACRLVGYLAARMLLDGMDSVPIMRAAKGMSLTGEPAEILRAKHVFVTLETQ